MNIMSLFGKRLRFLRKRSNLTQDQLAKILNVSTSSIGMYERGEREPSFKVLIDIAKYFSVSIDYLLGNNQDENSTIQNPLQSLSDKEEYILHLQQDYPELFEFLRNATETELKKLIKIIKVIQQ